MDPPLSDYRVDPVTRHPPTDPYVRHDRIRLLPWMHGVKAHTRKRMQDALGGNPAVNVSCLCFRAALRTPANPWDTPLPRCVGHVWDGLAFSLVHALPSPLSADGWPPLFEGFIGTITWSDSSETDMEAVRPGAFASRSGRCARSDISEVSRFSCR